MKPFRLWFVAPLLALLALLSAATMVRAQSTDQRLKDQSVKDEGSSKPRVPLATDWSHHHLIYSNAQKMATSDSPRAKKLQAERRFQQALVRRNAMTRGVAQPSAEELGARALRPANSVTTDGEGKLVKDWTSSLTTAGTVGDEQYPAKFSFNINAAPSCTADFVVFNNNQASGTHSSGFSTDAIDFGFFYGIPVAGAVIKIATVSFTAVAQGVTPTDQQFNIGTSATSAATNLVAAITAYAKANPGFTYTASNTNGFGFGRGRNNVSSFIIVTDTTGGTNGNNTTVSPSDCFPFFFDKCTQTPPDPNFSFFSPNFFGGRGGSVATVANLIGLNQLYTGSPTGMCTGTAPNVMFAYGVSSNGGVTATSPALSEDGTQIAIVESSSTTDAANCALVNKVDPCVAGSYLILVKWLATTGAPITGTVTVPNPVANTAYRTCVPTPNPCMTVVKFSSNTDSNSAPFVDYTNDAIYVGDDDGYLYEIGGVFVGTPGLVSWSNHAVDPTYALTGPVYDPTSGNIYVADANGIVSTVLQSNGEVTYQVQTASSPLVDGPSETSTLGYPIPDPPIVDSTAETVTVFVSNDNAAFQGADLDQFIICDSTNQAALGVSCTVGGAAYASTAQPQVGPAGVQMHDGDFDNSYYSGNYNDGYIYFCGKTPGPDTDGFYVTGGSDTPTIERAYFDTNGFLNGVDYGYTTGTTFNPDYLSVTVTGEATGEECSPLTEVYNGSNDYMFFSVQGGGIGGDCGTMGGTADSNPSGGCVMSIIVNDSSSSTNSCPSTTSSTTPCPTPMPTAVSASIGEPGGTSGIIIDNVSSAGQASSVYFSPLEFAAGAAANGNCAAGVGCAVKATQSGLQ
jgi:hypothetical protein